jgi:hypothetical protein
MPYDKSPTTFFGAGYSYSSSNKKITLSTNNSTHAIKLNELTNAEANQSTGDVRKLAYAIMMFMNQRIEELGINKPTKMTIASSSRSGSSRGSIGGLLKTFVVTFYRSNSSPYDVTAE